MNRRTRLALGLTAILCCLVAQPGALMAFDAPKTQATGLTEKAFFKPELYISSSNVPLEQLRDALPNKSAWTRFAEKYGQPQGYIDPRSGAATSIVTRIPMIPGTGDGNSVELKDLTAALGKKVTKVDPELVAHLVSEFVKANHAVIGIDKTQLGAAAAVQVHDTLWNIRIPQFVNGVPVRHGHMVAVIHSGNLVLLGTQTWGNAQVDTQPTITEDQATSIGFAFAGGRQATDLLWKKPSLEVVPFAPPQLQAGEGFSGPVGSGYGHRLVWAFGLERKGEDGRFEVLVDAHSGEVLSFEDENHYETKKMTGSVYPLTSTEICPSNDRCGTMVPDHPMPWADTGLASPNNFTNSAGLFNYTSGTVSTQLSGKYVRITDTCGAVNQSASGDILLGGVNGEHDCAVPAGTSAGNTSATRSAFYEVNKLAEQARGWLPANTWLQAQLQTNVNITQTCNAFYSPSAGTINFYRSGGGCRNTGEIAAVFDHEWGHALDDNDSGGALSSSSEAYADIAAIYRLQASCVGYGFFQTLNDGCGTTADGTGFNANESLTGTHCTLDCSGVRDADWGKHADNTPDTPQNFSCTHCSSGSGPCGRQVHCSAAPSRQAAWDLVNRDLTAPPFNMALNDAYIVGNKLFYHGSGTIGSWHACTCPSTSDGCGATNAYMGWLVADDDNGNLADGTPHMTAIFAAFNRHNIACATPTPTNSGCAGGPTTAPDLSVAVGSNSLSLSWTAVPGATSYRVLRSEGYAGCDFGKALIATVPGTSYTDPDVANGRTYSYVVQAVGTSSSCYGPGSACVQGTPQPCAGSISLTQELYNCSGAPLNITLVDGDLTGAGTQAVAISSNTEHGPENLVLSENPAGSGVFTGTFGTTTAPATPGDGAISISDGDTIAVDYLDVSYCGVPDFPVSKFASVDCSGPIISNVQISNVTGNSADVTFDTSEPTNAVAFFGTLPPPAGSVTDPTLSTSHLVHLSNLSGCTAYVVSVAATDPAGNTAADDNAGEYYGFITQANVTPTYVYTGPPVSIPDNTTVTATIVVPETKIIQDLNVKITNLTHTYDGDLDIFLVAPNGTQIELSTDNGPNQANFINTVFDDEAAISITAGSGPFTGSFRPEGLLSAVDGLPANGTWTLRITDDAGGDVGTLTAWELQFTHPPEQCPTVGTVTFDQASYQCAETAQIQVVDFSILGAGSQAVTVTSAAEPGGETIVLTETPANSASFVGTITLTTAPAAGGDGLLSITDGDTTTVTYIDADDGFGGFNIPRTDTALVDCTGPTIQGVQVTGVTGSAADITWTTNEPASSVAFYGPTPPPSSTVSSAELVTSHALQLSGLDPCTTYLFSVGSTDATSNSTTDDNGGIYFTFTTGLDFEASFASSGSVSIPDNNPGGGVSVINVPTGRPIADVDVVVNLDHNSAGQLVLSLEPPSGPAIILSNRRGGTGDDFVNTIFDDEAIDPISGGTAPFTGRFRPESPLSGTDGILASGNWTLRAVDAVSGTTGTILNWTLAVTFPNQTCAPHAKVDGHATVADICAAGGAGGDGTWDGGETVQLSVDLWNDGTETLTGVSATLTSPTPGVQILDGTAAYPNLVPLSGSPSTSPHFTIRVPSGAACDSDLALDVQIDSDQGTWNGSFTHKVGLLQSANAVAFSENFSGGIPAGWTVVNGGTGGGAAATWTTANPGNRTFAAPMVAPVAMVDSDLASSTSIQDEELITPVIDLSGALSATLQFDQFFRWFSGGQDERGDVDVRSSLTGGNWVNVFRNQGASSPNPDHKSLDITAHAAGAADVQIRFHYYQASFEWWWMVDNIRLDVVIVPGCLNTVCQATATANPVASLTASRVDASTIEVVWDAGACASTDYELLYGSLSDLPTYAPLGSVCDLGPSGSSTWSSVPAGNLWFVVTGVDDAGTEASWGQATAGERNGTSASGLCGNTTRNNAPCP